MTSGLGTGLAQILPVTKIPKQSAAKNLKQEEFKYHYEEPFSFNPKGLFSDNLANSFDLIQNELSSLAPYYQAKEAGIFLKDAQGGLTYGNNIQVQSKQDLNLSVRLGNEWDAFNKNYQGNTAFRNKRNKDLKNSFARADNSVGNNAAVDIDNQGRLLFSVDYNILLGTSKTDFDKAYYDDKTDMYYVVNPNEVFGDRWETIQRDGLLLNLDDIPLFGFEDNTKTISDFSGELAAKSQDWRQLLAYKIPYETYSRELEPDFDNLLDGIVLASDKGLTGEEKLPYRSAYRHILDIFFRGWNQSDLDTQGKFKTDDTLFSRIRLTDAGEEFAAIHNLDAMLQFDGTTNSFFTGDQANQLLNEGFDSMLALANVSKSRRTLTEPKWDSGPGILKSGHYSLMYLPQSDTNVLNQAVSIDRIGGRTLYLNQMTFVNDMGMETPSFRGAGEGTQLNAIDITPLKSINELGNIYNFDVYVPIDAADIDSDKEAELTENNTLENVMVRLENKRFVPDSLFIFNGEWYMAGTAFLWNGYAWDGTDYSPGKNIETRAFVYLGEKGVDGIKANEYRFKNYRHLSMNLGPQALYDKISANTEDLDLTYETVEFETISNGQVTGETTGAILFENVNPVTQQLYTVEDIIDMINQGLLRIK